MQVYYETQYNKISLFKRDKTKIKKKVINMIRPIIFFIQQSKK
jgi:hypothetical protein